MSNVGEQLRRAREARGLTVQQIAEETKLKLVQVEALESGDSSAFPAMVYMRGSLKSYAEVVKIDPTPLLEQLKEEQQGKDGNESQPYFDNLGEYTLFWRLLTGLKNDDAADHYCAHPGRCSDRLLSLEEPAGQGPTDGAGQRAL